MNLPNKLTLFRVIVVPFFVFCLLAGPDRLGDFAALLLFAAASLTDLADGRISRHDHLVTNFGKLMDPLADKLLVGSAAICFVGMGRLPAWVAVILIGREFVISGFRLVAVEEGVVIAADRWGKYKTTFQMLMTIALILHLDFAGWRILEGVLIGVSTALTVISLVNYLVRNRAVLQEPEG